MSRAKIRINGLKETQVSAMREAFLWKYDLSQTRYRYRQMSYSFMEQVMRCKSEEARRLLLGISE
jgi:hypothetical protein